MKELLFNNSLIINPPLISGECADGAGGPPQTSSRIFSKTQVGLFDEEEDGDCVLGVFAIPEELRLFFIMRRSRVESGTKQPGNSRADLVQIAAAFYHPSA